MRGFLYHLLLLLGAYAQAQTPKTTLWRISGPGSGPASYLFGTVHSNDDRAYQFGDSVLPALDRVNLVVGELDFEKDQGDLPGLLAAAQLPEGRTLKDYYRKREWKRVEAALKARLGPLQGLAHRLRPFFILTMLDGTGQDGTHERVLDAELQHRARRNGQVVAGLETPFEQLAAMDVMPLERQADILLENLEKEGTEDELDGLLDAYAAQDLDRLISIMEESKALPPELHASLIIDRNSRMAHRMDSLLRSGTTCFFAVGAGHLPSSTGLIAAMLKRGYTVEPVFSARAERKEE